MCSVARVCSRRTRLKIYSCLSFFLVVGILPHAAAQPTIAPADIESLIDSILINNAGLESQQLQVAASEELIASSGALDDPRINYAIAPNSIGDSIPSKFGDALRVRQNIQLSQTIPWPGKRSLRSEKMAASTEMAQQTYEVTRLNLITQARLLWAQWWYVNDALVSNLEHQRLATELTQVAETRYANGIGLQQDVLKVETHAIQLRHQHLVFEQEQRRLRAHINHLLNRRASTAIPAPSEALLTPELPPQSILEDWVINHHPELKELQAESNVAMLNRRLTEKDDYPDMQFNVGYNELWNESALRLQVGVSLNIPLDFGKRSARKSAAQYEYHSVQMALQNKRSELRSELEVGLSEFDQSAHGIHLIETELLPSAEQTVNATQANYESGGGNFFELIDAQEQLLDMHLLLSNSIAEQYMALAELNQLTGGQLWARGENQ
ncbi:MAG: hypothetical protein COB20_14605 [SAR86 cluster bacterium]|uniref:Transporter n=1 Tax=SAR86 cluster bacterium TaxID=2030880 RepID=A0A2A4WWP9_9GAMM|nr:MAG: hypothetical protein COB20_14605 [SAR86 cluster bacterium]